MVTLGSSQLGKQMPNCIFENADDKKLALHITVIFARTKKSQYKMPVDPAKLAALQKKSGAQSGEYY